MRPEEREEVSQWLERAQEDLRSAEVDLSVDPPIVRDALFHCQQAAEKALKGFLTVHNRPFQKTHDLAPLANRCEEIDASLHDVLVPARDLTVYAWQFRYPGGAAPPGKADAEATLDLARSVYRAVLSRLPMEVRPGEPS